MRDEPTPATTGAWRMLRGAVVGGTATLLAVGGHCLAGAHPPGWVAVVGLALLLGATSIRLSDARWTFPRLLAVLVSAQAGLHGAFVATAPDAHAHAHAAGVDTPGLAALAAGALAMPAAHLGAAVLTALLLRRGETWLVQVLDALALRCRRLLDANVTGYGLPAVPVVPPLDPLPRLPAAGAAWSRRGPPAC